MRKLPAAAQEERRRQVIGLRESGLTHAAIAAQVGLSENGVSGICRRYAERGLAGLTPREVEVLRLLVEGRSNRQIAEQLFISGKTASVHVTNILAKLGVHSRLEAAAAAHRLGLDQPAQDGPAT